MTFPNDDNNQGGQMQMPPPPPDAKKDDDSGGGIIQWIGDSYNGLYKIVLEPSMPKIYQVLLIVFGAILGLLWAYVIFPTVFTGANPNRLNDAARDQWVRMVAVGTTGSPATYTAVEAADLLDRVPQPLQTIERLASDPDTPPQEAESLRMLGSMLTGENTPTPSGTAAPQGNLVNSILQIVLLIVLIGVITPIVTLVWRLLIYENLVAPVWENLTMSDEDREKKAAAQADLKRLQEQAERRKQLAAQAADTDLGEPVMTNLAIYSPGRNFDESYEIELPSGEFLGQSGAVIAEAVSDPVAIEIWLFDMFSQQENRKIFVTPTANNDPVVRSKLDAAVDNPAEDIIVAAPGAALMVESEKIKLQGKMAEVDFNPNGEFENFELEMRAWQADGAAVPAGGGAASPPPIPPAKPPPDYSDIEFDPPPQMPQGNQTPPPPSGSGQQSGGQQPLNPPPLNTPPPPSGSGQQSGGQQPLTPPPLNFPPSDDDNDDDPFGGTGDFTPLNN